MTSPDVFDLHDGGGCGLIQGAPRRCSFGLPQRTDGAAWAVLPIAGPTAAG